MRVLMQRVGGASVHMVGNPMGEVRAASIKTGVLLFVGIAHSDGEEEAAYLARKIAGLRIFEDSDGKMNLALADVDGAALVVSQFTLYADVRKGRRPSFTKAARPEIAEPLYESFCWLLEQEGVRVHRGVFQAHMQVSLVNDGPVTLWLDTDDLMTAR